MTQKIFLDELTPSGQSGQTLKLPAGKLVTSFSSKSELALNLSTDGQDVTFMGYVAPNDTLDASNSNTPEVIDSTNPVTSTFYRGVAELNGDGRWSFTETNAYSGNNGRAAILNNADNVFYTAGNAGNGSNPQPEGMVLGAGGQILTPSLLPESQQSPGTPTPVGSFSITEIPANKKPDKVGKDDNFRGMTISNDVLYYTKGSGSNGIDTVYYVDTKGGTCPQGSGVPASDAQLPTSSAFTFDPTKGLQPNNMCILNGFPTTLAKNIPADSFLPFGLWFANPTTLYVADEGSGSNTFSHGKYTDAASQTNAGLQKWVYDQNTGSWTLAYTIQDGLDLDQGADPNKLVSITDQPGAMTLPTSESFTTVRTACSGEVLRGVSLTPGS